MNFLLIIFLTSLLNFSHAYENLLTSDFKILTHRDLLTPEENVSTVKFSEDSSSAFAFWKCFESGQIEYQIKCEDMGIQSDNENYAAIEFFVDKKNSIDAYFQRRAYPTDACLRNKKEIEGLIKNEEAFCIRAFFINKKSVLNHKRLNWTIDRVKSHKGCWSYFVGDCPN